MDVTELRRAFTLADTVSQRLEGVRLERLATIAGDERLATGGTIVLHLQPLDSLDPENVVDFLRARQDITRLFLIYHCAPYLNDSRFINDYRTSVNFDGLLSVIERNPALGYVQLYRSGVIESVDTILLDGDFGEVPCIPGTNFEQKIVDATLRYLGLLRDLEVRSPVLVNLSLLRVRGYTMRHTTEEFGGTRTAATRGSIDRDDLLLRGKLIQAIPQDLNEEFVRDLLREDFHAIWNATGFDGSPSYD